MDIQADKNEKSPLPIVALDGAKVKKIREAKKLTQLYVASVVGVTTDTISRWENNRYPTIKRDNAEKLAQALEVELEEILQQQEAVEEVEEPPPPPEKKGFRHLVALALISAIIIGAVVFSMRRTATTPAAVRWLPRFGAPGEIIPVQIRVNRKQSDSEGFIIKEHLPAGWRLVNAVPSPSTGQESAGEIKWLIPGGAGPITLSYTVQVPPAAPQKTEAAFSGNAVVHVRGTSQKETIVGARAVTVSAIHWADQNGDGVIDDSEIMPAYYRTEEMKGLGLDWKTIEAIWSGKGYRWNPDTREFVVVK